MKNKFVKINDLYFEIQELCDYYNLEYKFGLIIDAIFEMGMSCALKRKDWKYSDYVRLSDILIFKEEFNVLIKAFFNGGVKNETHN